MRVSNAVRTAAAAKPAAPKHVTLSATAYKRALSILKTKLPDHLQSDGVVSLKGKPTFEAGGAKHTYEVSGKIDVNALWGGDATRNFKAKLDLTKGTMTGFKSW